MSELLVIKSYGRPRMSHNDAFAILRFELTLLIEDSRENPGLVHECNENGETGLIYACRRRPHPRYRNAHFDPDYDVIKTLLYFGSDPKARNNQGKTGKITKSHLNFQIFRV